MVFRGVGFPKVLVYSLRTHSDVLLVRQIIPPLLFPFECERRNVLGRILLLPVRLMMSRLVAKSIRPPGALFTLAWTLGIHEYSQLSHSKSSMCSENPRFLLRMRSGLNSGEDSHLT